jgi:flagellar protein FliS
VTTDALRARYLRDRVMTATPAQRVVMLYDRLGLDLRHAAGTDDPALRGTHLGHGMQVLAELRSSLDITAGGPADNLAALYGYLITAVMDAQTGDVERLSEATDIVASLRQAWAQASEALAGLSAAPTARAAAGAWVG